MYIDEALAGGKLSGNGVFGRRCAEFLEQHCGAARALVTPSCTAALELAALLCAGDDRSGEVIVPSFTFVSTANAFALHGMTPVFADVCPDTLNIDPSSIERALSPRTRAIVVVHYGGVACDMEAIEAIAAVAGVPVIEDAAHALPAAWRARPLGSLGALSTFSFHETKNVQCGEGGALVINDPALAERAEIMQEKGTNRARFFRGEVDKYTWVDLGSSYLLSEVAAAFLWGQLERLDEVTAGRREVWARYHEALADAEAAELLRRPIVPPGCEHSGHLYHLLLPDERRRDRLISELAARGVHAVFHYLPLHRSPAGQRLGRSTGPLPVSEDVSGRLVRLPLWSRMPGDVAERVVDSVRDAVGSVGRRGLTSARG